MNDITVNIETLTHFFLSTEYHKLRPFDPPLQIIEIFAVWKFIPN